MPDTSAEQMQLKHSRSQRVKGWIDIQI